MRTDNNSNVAATSSSSSSSTMQQHHSSSSSSSAGNNSALPASRVPLTLRDYFFQDPFFKNAWEDFDRIQRDMMRQSQEFWAKVRQDSTGMAAASGIDMSTDSSSKMNSSNNNNKVSFADDDFFGGSSDLAPLPAAGGAPFLFPRRWMLPRFLSRDESEKLFPSEFFDLNKKEEQVLRVKDDDSKFELSLDTHEYRPDELKVNVEGNVLSVDAKHEEKGDNKFVSRQFSRKYTLPAGCEPHKVSSNLSSDGILMISAPKRQAIKEDAAARPVPIEMKK